jgi:hypothetical protein
MAVARNRKRFRLARDSFMCRPTVCREREINAASYSASTNNHRRWIMPFLIPVLIGIPVLFGGGYVIYHLVH